jgi:hypothetical protein
MVELKANVTETSIVDINSYIHLMFQLAFES